MKKKALAAKESFYCFSRKKIVIPQILSGCSVNFLTK